MNPDGVAGMEVGEGVVLLVGEEGQPLLCRVIPHVYPVVTAGDGRQRHFDPLRC